MFKILKITLLDNLKLMSKSHWIILKHEIKVIKFIWKNKI